MFVMQLFAFESDFANFYQLNVAQVPHFYRINQLNHGLQSPEFSTDFNKNVELDLTSALRRM